MPNPLTLTLPLTKVPPQALVLLEDVDVAFVQREANDRRVGASFPGLRLGLGLGLLNA